MKCKIIIYAHIIYIYIIYVLHTHTHTHKRCTRGWNGHIFFPTLQWEKRHTHSPRAHFSRLAFVHCSDEEIGDGEGALYDRKDVLFFFNVFRSLARFEGRGMIFCVYAKVCRCEYCILQKKKKKIDGYREYFFYEVLF